LYKNSFKINQGKFNIQDQFQLMRTKKFAWAQKDKKYN